MDIFTLRMHMCNIIDVIVGIKFIVFCNRRVPVLIIFRSITKCGIVRWKRVEEADGGCQGNQVYSCASGCYYSALHDFANV